MRTKLNAVFFTLTMLAVANLALACSWLRSTSTAAAHSFVDCTKGEASKVVSELGPVVDQVLANATDSAGHVSWGPVRDITKRFTADVGGCVLADVVTRALQPTPTDPKAPKSSPLELDRDALRADFRRFAADAFAGATFKTAHGEL